MKHVFLLGIVCLAFPQDFLAAGKQLTGQHAPATSPALPAVEAQKQFTVPEGFEVRLFAAEPDVVNPVAMTWDERGRLWIVELYEYPLGAPAGKKPRDCIKILEDTDNDGRADKVTVFADGLNLATAILCGNGGVYVGQAPELLFLQDTNGDDVADKRTVLLSGFGLHDRHELLNGFTWGPDGWLYMTHGVFTQSKVKIPEATTPGIEMNAAVARFHPRTKQFEIYADGTSNPWGVDFDKYGNAFVSACVIDHLFHMAPGGIYQRQGGIPGNPYAYELLPSIVDHKHHMAAYCGICVYEGDMFPTEYRGRVFMGNIHQNAINHDKLTANGSSFKATIEPDFVTTTDGWFRPVSEQVGPDGALWIADWHDKYPCYQNAQADPEGVDRERGRIWRVVYTGTKVLPASRRQGQGGVIGSRPEKKMDLKKLKSDELVQLLEHPNMWQRKTAQRVLTENLFSEDETSRSRGKGRTPTISLLEQTIKTGKTIEARLAAVGVLDGSGQFFMGSHDTMLIEDKDPVIRAWGARLLGEMRAGSSAILVLEKLASDPDARVRHAVAVACRQLVSSSLTINTDIDTKVPVGKVLTKLIQSSADAKDPLIPFMIWMASEPLLAANPEPGLKWLAENGADTMPLSGILARKAMRRICDTGEADKMNIAVKFVSAIAQKNDQLTLAAVDGLIEGQRAKPLQPTVDTQPVLAQLAQSSNTQLKERAQQLATMWGDAGAAERTIALINNTNASLDERIRAIRSAQQLKNEAARAALLKMILSEGPEQLVLEALRSLSALGDDAAADKIVKDWSKITPKARGAAVEMLASRPGWIRRLLDGLEDKTISAQDISATVARTMATSKNPSFAARAQRLLGRYRDADADKLKVIAEKRKMVLAGEPNLKRGQEIATKVCFVCHKLHGEGAEVGPDLTGVGRSTLDALLANVIDPNQVIGKGYELVEVETKDDRSISGRLVEENDRQLKLLSAGPTETVVAKSDIQSTRVLENSVMPEGLEQMPDDDFRDMIWYILAPPQEGPLTAEKRGALIGK